ncbi:MAG: nucleoside monophosphate kinase [Candidatus Omnitrophica bacterium]|nr:nucleoside monophosphate kinase [Candidatus Omnitrophota bacterium]
MLNMVPKRQRGLARRVITVVAILALICTAIVPGYAQSVFVSQLPAPGSMVNISPGFVPVLVKGLIIHPDKPLNFDFIVDTGNDKTDSATIKDQTQRMAKYFLAAITVPESQLWVNLSPYEKNRVIEKDLGQTVLGRDMLAQDYILKQLTASLMGPENGLGKEFWDKVYREASKKFGMTDIPVDIFNKVWIMPDKAEVFEKNNAVYVTEAKLKVLLDSDHEAQKKSMSKVVLDEKTEMTKTVMREVILPAIEQEVNTGKNFAAIRQIYHAAILAKWYRERIKDTLLAQAYVGKNKITGVTSDEKKLKEEIYERYISAYKKGVLNYIKETYDPLKQEIATKKYFSGGIEDFGMQRISLSHTMNPAAASHVVGKEFKVDLAMIVGSPEQAGSSGQALKANSANDNINGNDLPALEPLDVPTGRIPVIVLLGIPSSGKGTVGPMLAEKLGIPKMSAGDDIVRKIPRKPDGSLNNDPQSVFEAEKVYFRENFERFKNGFIFDYHPMTKERQRLHEVAFRSAGFEPLIVVQVDIDPEVALKRNLARPDRPEAKVMNPADKEKAFRERLRVDTAANDLVSTRFNNVGRLEHIDNNSTPEALKNQVDALAEKLRPIIAQKLKEVRPHSQPVDLKNPDKAMSSDSNVGGIDLKNVDMKRKPASIQPLFNEKAVREVIQNGFTGFTPVIINIVPIQDPLMILSEQESGNAFKKTGT